MAEDNMDATSVLTEFSTRIRDLEDRHNMLKEKALLLGQSFLKQEEELRKDLAMMRDEMKEMRLDMDRAKEAITHIIQESENFARREELRSLDKYIKIWEPLKFVKAQEVQRMIDEALKKQKYGSSAQ